MLRMTIVLILASIPERKDKNTDFSFYQIKFGLEKL